MNLSIRIQTQTQKMIHKVFQILMKIKLMNMMMIKKTQMILIFLLEKTMSCFLLMKIQPRKECLHGRLGNDFQEEIQSQLGQFLQLVSIITLCHQSLIAVSIPITCAIIAVNLKLNNYKICMKFSWMQYHLSIQLLQIIWLSYKINKPR